MAKQTRKQRSANKRKEIRKRQRMKRSALPALLRQNPDLLEALNYRHPLVKCLINENWHDTKLASAMIIREAPTGLVLCCFLVDLLGPGLKDVWGNYGLTDADIEKLESKSEARDNPLIICNLSLATTIIHGGIAWAKKWGFKLPREYKIWLRLTEPVSPAEIDLDLFGKDGKPVVILHEDDLDILEDAAFDPRVLRDPIDIGSDGPSRQTLSRLGDIKAALIRFSRSPNLADEFQAAFEERFGKNGETDSEDAWITFQDWFVLENKLEDDGTVAQRFVEEHKHRMSDDVRELVLGWGDVLEGLFEVKGKTEDGYAMKCLINEKDYTVYATTPEESFDLALGDCVHARIVPAKGFHVFSGMLSRFESDGSQEFRAWMYDTAVKLQTRVPRLAFKDNEEKLNKSLEITRDHHRDFVGFFDSDEVVGTGREIQEKYRAFMDYLVFEKEDPETGLPRSQAFEKKTGESYRHPNFTFPKDLLRASDVGMLSDPVGGVEMLIDYQGFVGIFQDPETSLEREKSEDLVLGYLHSDSISDVAFRKVAQRFPDNFSQVMGYYLGTNKISADHIDGLMHEFKPWTFEKLPTTVAILDSEMARLSRMAKEKEAEQESRPVFGKLKSVFKKGAR